MRRRRLIGVYRGLLMAIWMPWLRFDFDVRGGGAWRRDKKSLNMRRVHTGKLADHAAQHNRVKVVLLCAPQPGESLQRSVALTLAGRYAMPHWFHHGCILNTIEARVGATCVPTNRFGPGVE